MWAHIDSFASYASHTSVSCSGLLCELALTPLWATVCEPHICKLQWTPIWAEVDSMWAPVFSYVSSHGLLCELQWSPIWAPVVSYVSSSGLLCELSWTPIWALMDSYVSSHGLLCEPYVCTRAWVPVECLLRLTIYRISCQKQAWGQGQGCLAVRQGCGQGC